MLEPHSSDKIIELSNCSIWQQDHLVLSDVSLSVRKGEFIYLVGKVGSGKTSLLKPVRGSTERGDSLGEGKTF